MDRSSRENQYGNTDWTIDLTDMYRTFHPVAAEYAFISVVHLTFSRRDQIIGHQKFLENLRTLKSYWYLFQPQGYKTGNWHQEVNSQICGD